MHVFGVIAGSATVVSAATLLGALQQSLPRELGGFIESSLMAHERRAAQSAAGARPPPSALLESITAESLAQ